MSRSDAAWAKWRRLVRQQERSGLSVQRFCIERGLAASSLFSWRRKLREVDGPGELAVRGRTRSGGIPQQRGFVEVLGGEAHGCGTDVHRCGGDTHEYGRGRRVSRAAQVQRDRPLQRDRALDGERSRCAGAVAVELACGRRLIIGPGFDRDLLVAVIETIERMDAGDGWTDGVREGQS